MSSRSDRRSASLRSEVATSTAVPSSASCVMIRWISSLAPTSTPWVGSARTSTWAARRAGARGRPSARCPRTWRRSAAPRSGLDGEPPDHVAGDLLLASAVDPDLGPDSSGRCETEMLKRSAGRRTSPAPCGWRAAARCRAAAPRAGGADGPRSPRGAAGRRSGGACRRPPPRSRRRRSRRARRARRSRPGAPARRRRGSGPRRSARRGRAAVAGGRGRAAWSSSRVSPTISSTTLRT